MQLFISQTDEINEKNYYLSKNPTHLLGLRRSFFRQRLAAMNSRTTTRAKKTTRRTIIRVLFIIEVPTSIRKLDHEPRFDSLEAIYCCLLKTCILKAQRFCPWEDKFVKTNNRSLLDVDKSSISSFAAKPSVVVDCTNDGKPPSSFHAVTRNS